MTTPEFLLWAVEHVCPIRGFQDGSDPERTERQLRAAQAYSEACREGRVFEGLCLNPPFGFRSAEALRVYGGQPAVEQACRGCPANARSQEYSDALAGCCGFVPLPAESRLFHEGIEEAIVKIQHQDEWPFSLTSPRWYGVFIDTPLAGDRLHRLPALFAATLGDERVASPAFAEFALAVAAAAQAERPLHVRLYPAGFVAGPWWRLVAHCPRCKAAWSDAASRRCHVCGYLGPPAPNKKRHARGQRPYFPLTRLLGDRAAGELLARYAAACRVGCPIN